MLIKYAAIAVLCLSSVMAAMTKGGMMKALIDAGDGYLEEFSKFEKEQNHYELSMALHDMAVKKEHSSKVAKCLESIEDSYPTKATRVSRFAGRAIFVISRETKDKPEVFARVIASLNSDAIKILTAVFFYLLRRDDAVDVLKEVVRISPDLVIANLSNWLASHFFSRNSKYYDDDRSARESAFDYLVSFAGKSVLNSAGMNAMTNDHFRVDSTVHCCSPGKAFPNDLIYKLADLWELAKSKDMFVFAVLKEFLPTVLINILNGYLTVNDLIGNPVNAFVHDALEEFLPPVLTNILVEYLISDGLSDNPVDMPVDIPSGSLQQEPAVPMKDCPAPNEQTTKRKRKVPETPSSNQTKIKKVKE